MLKNFLLIDTATDVLYVAMVKDHQLVYTFKEKGDKDHAVKLMPHVIEAFEQSSIASTDLDGIVVGEGPGSYTGVRMGVVVAKMLALEWNLPLYKVSSLLLMVSGQNGWVAPVIDARRDHVFGAVYEITETLKEHMAPTYLLKTDLQRDYPQAVIFEQFQPDILKLNQLGAFEKVNEPSLMTPLYLRMTQAEAEL
jgi:tRNA threonylcarbamoyladenosine biosynthesis protein TsaB